MGANDDKRIANVIPSSNLPTVPPEKNHFRFQVAIVGKKTIVEVIPNGARPHGEWFNSIILGNALAELKKLPAGLVDLVVTSPPYADARKRTYGGIHPDKYVEWFKPISAELMRVLKPTGSFVLNIKEKVEKGERHTYVLDLIHAFRKQGWLWTEEYIWHKKNCFPGKWPNRFRSLLKNLAFGGWK